MQKINKMIYPAKYNGINFSYDFTRESIDIDFSLQRKIAIIPADSTFGMLSFFWRDTEVPTINFNVISDLSIVNIPVKHSIYTDDGTIFFFEIDGRLLDYNVKNFIKLSINEDVIFSEYFITKDISYFDENEICKITAYNDDFRHGYLNETYPAFGFFKYSVLKSDFFINKKIEYEGTYGRKTILKSESNIGKRLVFHDLSMYQQNLLKWLCNCQNLFIDGVKYQLISDFTEILSDQNSEIMSLQADFVETKQSFFGDPSTKQPTNIFTSNFFMK